MIPEWGKEYGFADVGIAMPTVDAAAQHLQDWLARGDHADMTWMANNLNLRMAPTKMHLPTKRIIVCRMNYLPQEHDDCEPHAERATVARYALGRDYHKLVRKRLGKLAQRIQKEIAPHRYRVACDSAPVMERALASDAGLGWIGKNTMLINKEAGSWFFLGVLLTDLALPINTVRARSHCGQCKACLDACPTKAFRGPYQLDARKCISYLTIENRGSIPEALRPLIGNRIFGCDECQRVCPWNHVYEPTQEQDFRPRHNLDTSALCDLFMWSESDYMERSTGMAIRRCGYLGWLRNIAVALGNAPSEAHVIATLQSRAQHPSALVREHVCWALTQHGQHPQPHALAMS